jgi:hypothetical protein
LEKKPLKLTDAVVPFHPKDYSTLQLCLNGLKKIGIERVFLIGSENPNLPGTYFINENEIQNIFPLRHLSYLTSRAGWIFQQIIKLGSDLWISDLDQNYLVCDSDIVFISNPYEEIEDCFPYQEAYTKEYHLPYRINYKKLMKEEPQAGFSFINHHMVFNKENISTIREHIEKQNKIRWDLAILQSIDFNTWSGFSEYDLYGNWMFRHKKDQMKRVQMNIVDIERIPQEQDFQMCQQNQIHILSAQAWKRT